MPLVRIQIRRDTAANWTAANPVLAAGEPAVETDTGKMKIGDGIRNWSTLPYESEASLSAATPAVVGTAASGAAVLASRADHSHALPEDISCKTLSTSGNATIGGDFEVKGKFSVASQTVAASDVTGLDEAVDDRVSDLLVEGTGISLTYDDGAGSLTVAVGSHSQAIDTITGLEVALDGKADATHTHAQEDVDGLEEALTLRPTSDPTSILGAAAITNIVSLSQVAYDTLTPKSATTLYVIT